MQRQSLREAFGKEGPDQRQRYFRDPKYIAALGRLAAANASFTESILEAEGRPLFKFAARLEDRGYMRQVGRIANLFAFVLRAEAARALNEASKGEHEAALERLIRLYQLARRGYQASPSFEWWNMVNNLIRDEVHWSINRVLISGTVSDRTRDALDEALSHAEENVRSAAWAQQGQKLFLVNSYQTFDQVPPVMSARFELRVFDLANRIEIAETMAKFAPHEGRTGKSALEEHRRLRKEFAQHWKSPTYRAFFLPTLSATMNESYAIYSPFREIAVARCLRVLNALQRRKQVAADNAHLGLPAEATTDPFTEEPLRIVKTKTGWVVYSLGESQKELAPEEVWAASYVVGNVEELPKKK